MCVAPGSFKLDDDDQGEQTRVVRAIGTENPAWQRTRVRVNRHADRACQQTP